MPNLVERIAKGRIQAIVRKTIGQKRLEFVDDHQLLYTDREGGTQRLTFDQFSALMVTRVIEQVPQAMAKADVTEKLIKDVLAEEYKKGVKKV